MRKFLLISGGAMVVALALVVLVWAQLQGLWRAVETSSLPAEEIVPSATSETILLPATNQQPQPESSSAATSGIVVSELPMSEGQQAFLDSLGFDVETMVLSEALITCLRSKLGESRYQAILAGDTPTFLETAQLLPCIAQ